MTTGVQFTRHYRKVTLIFSFAFLCCLSSLSSWFAWMKLILGPLVLEAYKFKLKWVIWRVGLSEVCRSPDAKSCHSHLPLCPRMASCRGSNLSETLRCPDIAHNRLNLRLPITAQILSSSKVHRGHPGILLLTASSSTICICQSHTWYLSRTPWIYSCKFFLAGVNFYRFNAKNWHWHLPNVCP